MMHALEARRLLSAALEDGRVHITGTDRDDRIVVDFERRCRLMGISR